MKRALILILFIIALFPNVVNAQEKQDDIRVDRQIKGVLIGGLNLSQVDGDEVYGFHKLGFTGGFGGILPLGKRFSLSVEILYSQRGSYRKFSPDIDSAPIRPYYKLNWDFMYVPVMFHFEDRSTWTFGVGFSYGRMINFREIEHNQPKDWDRSEITFKTKNDFNVIADIRFRIWKHLKFNAQYSYSLAKIRTRYFNPVGQDPEFRNQFNNVITVRLLYYLNEKYLPERYKYRKKKKTTSD